MRVETKSGRRVSRLRERRRNRGRASAIRETKTLDGVGPRVLLEPLCRGSVRDIADDVLWIDKRRELLLLSGACILSVGLDDLDEFAQHSTFEFELDAVHGGLERRLQVPQPDVFKHEKRNVHGDDDEVDREELVENAGAAGVLFRPKV